jgi:RNA polymerase sigma factor (sigma-70 family)
MQHSELITLLQKKDPSAQRQIYEHSFSRLSAIALRYCKSKEQAEEAMHTAFNICFDKLLNLKNSPSPDLDSFMEQEFIHEVVQFIKSIRSEYYVSSTVYAVEIPGSSYNLFEVNDRINYNSLQSDVFIKALHQLTPSQRLILNMHVIDGIGLAEASLILESSEATVKSNLEKARFNLQKNIDKQLKKANP